MLKRRQSPKDYADGFAAGIEAALSALRAHREVVRGNQPAPSNLDYGSLARERAICWSSAWSTLEEVEAEIEKKGGAAAEVFGAASEGGA